MKKLNKYNILSKLKKVLIILKSNRKYKKGYKIVEILNFVWFVFKILNKIKILVYVVIIKFVLTAISNGLMDNSIMDKKW